MADRGYEAWYERLRETDELAGRDISDLAPQDALREVQDYSPTPGQKEAVAGQMAKEDVDDVNQRNTVSTERQTDLDDTAAFRPSDYDETMVRTTQGAISAERVEGSYEYNGDKYVRVDGKVYGKVIED